MRFYKCHGAGNDFIVVDNREGAIPQEKLPLAAQKLCHRNFGVGGDGLVLIEDSSRAEVKFRIFNPDGSEPGMCGNGIRCFAKHVYDHGIVKGPRIKAETLAGTLEVEVVSGNGESYVRVDMGRPKLERGQIPALGEGRLLGEKVNLADGEVEISAVNTGVPHVVTFVEGVAEKDIVPLAREIRYSSLFPRGANVNFVEVLGENRLAIRTYERGVEAETLACGTGIVASAVVAYLTGRARGEKVELQARGGVVYVELEAEGEEVSRVYMVGPAERVFQGEIEESSFLVG